MTLSPVGITRTALVDDHLIIAVPCGVNNSIKQILHRVPIKELTLTLTPVIFKTETVTIYIGQQPYVIEPNTIVAANVYEYLQKTPLQKTVHTLNIKYKHWKRKMLTWTTNLSKR